MEIFEERGITADIAAARPYVRYERGELDGLLDLSPAFRDAPAKVKWRTDRSGGWVMMKTPVPGTRAPIIPQFRPDKPLVTAKSMHAHADVAPKSRELHVAGPKHAGSETDEEHEHIEEAKYLLWPKPRLSKDHKHDDYVPFRKDGSPLHNRQRHVSRYHGGDDPRGSHRHTFSIGDPEQSPEKRLDMHPGSAALLPDAQRIFFVIEGVLKADALLSVGECAFDVPSVTLWDAPELPRFARKYLRGREVYVIPDEDWTRNPEVALQAFEAREALRRHGALAEVAAPPGPEKGVDDYLARTRSAAGLVVLRRTGSAGFKEWSSEQQFGLDSRWDRGTNDVLTLEWLTRHATADGLVKKSAEVMARYVGSDPRTISNAVNRLIGTGALERVGGGPALRFADNRLRVIKRKGHRDQYINTGAGWQSTPTFRIRADLRAESHEDVLPELS